MNYSKINPCPEIWAKKSEESRYPQSEMGYIRADYDGYRWWNKPFTVHKELEAPTLVNEIDMVYSEFVNRFPTLGDMSRFCFDEAEPVSDTEFNAYAEGEHGYYWLRMITRKGDYNLYLHCFSKQAIAVAKEAKETRRVIILPAGKEQGEPAENEVFIPYSNPAEVPELVKIAMRMRGEEIIVKMGRRK